jgi:hypothetical protein
MMKPTVIGAKGADKTGPVRNPTVIPTTISSSAPLPAPTLPRPTPTVMPAGVAKPSLPNPVQVTKPTTIPGVERKRIGVTLADLHGSNDGVNQDVLEQALQLILATNVDSLTDRTVVLWGHDLQKCYTDLVTKCLTLSQSGVLSKVSTYLSRMMEILGSIDLRKVSGLEGGDGVMSRLLKKATARTDSVAELESVLHELGQLIKLMNDTLQDLLQLKEQLEQVSGEINGLGTSIEVYVVTSAFLGSYLEGTNQTLAQRFHERCLSLTQTLAQIRSGGSIRMIQVEQPLQLISAVQNVALVRVPDWIGSIVSIKTMMGRGFKPTVTEIDELGHKTTAIIAKLRER